MAMVTHNVTAPDGSILHIEGPENADPAAIVKYAQDFAYPAYLREQKAKAEPPKDNYPTLAAAADVPLSFGRGAVTGVKAFVDAFGADSSVSQTLSSVDTYLEDLMSAQSKKDSQEVSRIIDEAKDKGAWDQVKAGLNAFSVAPVDLLTNAFGTVAPTALAGLLAFAAAPAVGVGTGAAVLATQIGVGAVSGAGTIKDRIYTDVKQALTDQGVAPEKAEAAAQEAQAYEGKNLDQIMLGALFGAGASATGADKILVKGLVSKILGNAAKEAVDVTEQAAAKGFGRRLVEGAVKEAVPEALQEGQEQVASNIAQQREGVDVPTFQGAGTSAALAGTIGAIMGGGLNVATTSGPRTVDKEAENAVLLKALETNRRAMDDDKFLEFANTLRDRVPVLGEILDSNVPRATKLSLIQSRIAEANIGGTQEQIDVGGPRGLPAPEIQKSENLRQVLNNTMDIADRAGVPLGDLTVNQGPEGWRIVSPDSKIMSDPMPLGSEREANVVLEGIRRTHDERQTERYRAESDEYRRDLDKQMTAATVAAARESMTPFEPISLDEIYEYDPALFNKIYDSRLKDKSVATKEDVQAPVTIDELRKRGAKRDDINHFAIQQKPFTAGTGGLRPGIEDELYGVGVKPTESKPMAKTEEELARQKYATVTPVDIKSKQVQDIEEEAPSPPSQEAQDLRDAYTRLRTAGYTDEQIGGLTKDQFYNALVEGDGVEFSRSKDDKKSDKERKKIYALYDQIEAGRDRRENGVTAPVKPLRSALAPELTDEEIADARKIIEDRVAKYEAVGKQGAAIGKGVRDAIANSDFTPNQLLQAFQVADISARLLGKTDADPHALEFVQRIATPFGDTAGGARIAPSEKLQGIIKMALDNTYAKSTTAHESFHVLQDLFAAYDKAGAKIINDAFKGATSFDDIDANLLRKLKSLRDPDTGDSVYTTLKENVEDKGLLEGYDQATREREMQAYVFGYMDNAITNGNQSMGGLGAAFVRFLNYYRQFKARVGNYFRGLGYQTAEDVLGATSRGTRQTGLGVEGELVRKALPGESEEFSRGKEPSKIVEKAKAFATKAHEKVKQLRKYTNDPYIVHPEEAVQIVRTVPHTDAMLAATWLHDVVEDTGVPIEAVRAEFGNEVADLVGWLTDVSRPDQGNRAVRKAIDREHSAAAPAEAQTIKLADLISNTRSIVEYDKKFAKVYLEEKRLLLDVMTKGDATLMAEAKRVLKEGQKSLSLPSESEEFSQAENFSRIGMPHTKILDRDSVLEENVAKLEAGEITPDQWDALVRQRKPVELYDIENIPVPATPEQAVNALYEDKQDKYGLAKQYYKEGDPVKLRLDIPAYARKDGKNAWVNAIHDGSSGTQTKKPSVYESVSAATDVTFSVTESAALATAKGAGKAPYATMRGGFKPITPKEAYAKAKQVHIDPAWVQVGMDPTRHSFFYTRGDMKPVVAAEEVLQIGPLVYAKNPTYAGRSNFEFSRAKPSEVPLQDRVPGLKAVWPHLTPDERERLVVVSARSLVRRFEELPSSAEMAAVAFSGRAKRGWYYNSAKALINIFGLSDGRRFAALLAATSPQTSVQSNLINALNIWKNWVNAGRPTGQKEILSIMGRSVEGSRGEDSVLDAWKNNTIRALATKDAHLIDLDISGPKVNSFMKNLWGVTQEVTNDAWIANYAGVDQKIFARSAGPRDELGVVGVKSPGYMAMSAVTRKAADILSEKTGETWTPDEVQETVWSWAKALYEMRRGRGKDTTTKALLKQGELTAERVNAVPDFEVLFVQNVYRKILEDAGYGEQVGRQAEIVQERGRGTESGGKGINAFDAEKSGFAQSDFQRHLLEAADRLENLYQTRLNAGEPEGEIEFSRAAALTGDSVEEFKAWWKKSQAVDENGQPKTYYTGKATTRIDKATGKPFKTFGRAGSGALVDATGVPMRGVEGPYYFSPEPPFASQFAMRRLSNYDFKEKRADQAAEGGRMIPAFLSVQNPFDYDNQDHVYQLLQDPMLKDAILRNNVYKAMIEMGWWKEIEKRVVQLAIRRAGFDGFYLMEQLPEFDDNNKPTGNKIVSKNLAVYKGNQIKSIFNQFLPGAAVSREFSRAIAATKQEKEAEANSTRHFQIWDKAREFFNPLALVNNLPQFLSFRNVTTGTITMSEQYARKMADKIAKGSVEERQAVYKFMTTKAGDSSLIKDPEIRKAAIEAKKAINDYAKLMVARKEMTQESFDNYYDRYLPRIYLLYEATNRGMKTPMGGTSVREYLDKRDEELSEEYRKVLGEIKDPSYLTYIALSRPARDIAMSDYLNNLFTFGGDPKNQWIAPQSIVEYNGKKYTPYDLQHMADDLDSAAELADNLSEDQAKAMRKEASKMRRVALAAQGDLKYKLDEIRARGYEQIPTRRQYGPLAGAVVQKGIYQDLVGTFIPVGKDNPSLIERLIGDEHSAVQKANALWKLGKTTLNPPTQVVNFVSNAISLNLFGGVPIHKFPYLFKKTMNEIMKNGSMYQEAQKFGLTGGTMSKVELDRAFIRMQRYQAKVGNEGNLVNMFATSRAIGSAFIEKAGDAYQFSESLFKMMMYIHSVETDKMKPSDAVNAANEIMFDYSLVNNNIRWLRNAPLGLPFITYYYKVLPKIIETLYKHPQRFIPYIALAYALPAMTMAAFDLDDDELEKLRLSAQDYVRDSGTLFFLPFRDSKGNIQFVDVGKYLPFSSLLSPFITAFKYGNYTKAAFELTRPITPSGPVITTIAALATGNDPFTNKPIMDPRDTNKAQALALFSYIFNQAMPPVISMDFNNFEKSSGALPRVYNSLFVDGTGVDKRGMPKPELLESAARILGLNITPLKADVQRIQNINYMMSQINKTRSLIAQTATDQSLMPERKREKNRELAEKVKEQVLEMQKYANDTANIGQITKKIKEAP